MRAQQPRRQLLLLALQMRTAVATDVDCTTVVTAAYKAIFDRDPDPAGLASKVSVCTAKTPWPANAFGPGADTSLVGKPWSPAGMVLEFRSSAEYKDKKLTPQTEKGGCHLCTAASNSPDCSVTTAPPEDASTVDCVISLAATECCMPSGGWGGTFLLVAVVGAALYAGGGAGYYYKVNDGAVGHPHRQQLNELGGLVVDGLKFAAAGGKKRGGSAGGAGGGGGLAAAAGTTKEGLLAVEAVEDLDDDDDDIVE
jgi:hypothetical protein